MGSLAPTRPLQVALINDYELVVRGLQAMLEEDDRLEIVALAAGTVVEAGIDVVLYDTFGSGEAHVPEIQKVIDSPRAAAVAVYSLNVAEHLVQRALERGATGYLSKSLPADLLADAIVRVGAGETVVCLDEHQADGTDRPFPGQDAGLTEREANVLALIVRGLENDEIADRLFISVNTVKSRAQSLYRKIGVTSRVQAATWGMKHGFDPDHVVIWEE